MTPPSQEPPTPPDAGAPPGLDYFAAHEPDRRRARSVGGWTFCLALAWAPYLCGIVNVLVAAQSYSAPVVGAHRGGAALFMGMGLVLSAAALAGFVRLRHWTGAAAAALLLAAQLSVAGCLAVSSFSARSSAARPGRGLLDGPAGPSRVSFAPAESPMTPTRAVPAVTARPHARDR